jgi:multiple sugar transport system permease protein
MAASTAVMLPTLLLFFIFQRAFIQGVVITGVKG